MATKVSATALDRFILSAAPRWGLNRIRARAAATAMLRHYEAASGGLRTEGWRRSGADANLAAGPALTWLRAHSRELVRNNSWAANGVGVLADNTVGWGLIPKAKTALPPPAQVAWDAWAESTDCDADGRLTYAGMQALIMRSVVESGEILIRRRWRRPEDGLALPLQLQLLEADFLDASRDGTTGQEGGPIIQGVEFDAIGRRVAYWLFQEHPGSSRLTNPLSRRVTAADIIHVYRIDRPGQVRGVPWLASAIVGLKNFDEFEDATLVKQNVAACFTGVISDAEGENTPLGPQSTTTPATATTPAAEMMEPGTWLTLPAGKTVTFSTPPAVQDDGFSARILRKIAAGLRMTYEDLAGDYSQVNFSSARMARLKHWAAVYTWRYNMLVPHACDGTWAWAMQAAQVDGLLTEMPRALWTPPPIPMLEPDKEGLAIQRMIRNGLRTQSEAIREQGYDPDTFYAEYAADQAKADALGIVLDSDPRKVTQAGQVQAAPKAAGAGGQGAGSEPVASATE